MKRLLPVLLLAVFLGLGGCASDANKAPVAAPSQEAAGGYSQEQSRYVYEKDEIVSMLKNGATVIARRVPSPVVSVRGSVAAGSLYEGQWMGGGLSHLLEHLLAGPTNGRRSEAENRNLLQRLGNNSNAFTTEDSTTFFVNTTAEHMKEAVDLVTGFMLTATIPQDEFDREHEVVQRELEMDMGNPDWAFAIMAEQNRYRVSPARIPVIGYKAVIQRLTRDDVYAYYKRAYQPNNMVFVVTGNLDPEQMLTAVRKYVGDAPPGPAFSHEIAGEPATVSPRTLVATFPKLGLAQVDLAFPSVRLSDDDLYPLDLLANVLGKGESSILVQELRDHGKLVSSISASDDTPPYVEGTFHVTMALEPESIGPATAAALAELEKVKKDGVSAERLKRSKAQLIAARYFGQQTSEDIGASLVYDFMTTGDPHFTDRYTQRLQKVTVDEIKRVAGKYLDVSRLITTALVPEEPTEPSPDAPKAGGKAAGPATAPSPTTRSAALPRAVDLLRAAGPTTRATAPEVASAVTRVVLKNGTVLLLKRIPTSPIVVAKAYAMGGLTAEDTATNGLGNLAMIMSPRGTKTRSAEQIAEFYDSIGGQLGTSCGSNTWNWSMACLRGDFPAAFDVFSDIVYNAAFPDAELPHLRQRVLGEIKNQDADWEAQAVRFFRTSYFGPLNSPYQFMAVGTEKNVKGFTAGQIRDWYAKKVMAAPRVLAIYGDIDIDKAKALAESNFGKAAPVKPIGATRPSALPVPPASDEVPSLLVSRVEVKPTQNDEAGVFIGFKSDSVVGDSDVHPLTVGKTMASGYGYPTGYIFEILRGRGLVYDASAYIIPGRNSTTPGAFVAYAGCDPKNVNEVVKTILESIARLQGKPADMQADWFERSKKLITTEDAMDHETPAAQAETAALDELYGLGYAYHAKFADSIDAVTLGQVQNMARMRLRECVVTVSTSAPQLVDIKAGPRRYTSFPSVDLTPRGVQHDTGGK